MRFYTHVECQEWCRNLEIPLDDRQRPLRVFTQQFKHHIHCAFPRNFSQMHWFSQCIESSLQPREHCLLWVVDFGIFPSNENLQLYYRYRQSYGDTRLLDEAPGHLCLDYERPEVVSILYMSILFGWDVHVIPTVGYGRSFVSHDEYVDICVDDVAEFDKTCEAFRRAKLEFTPTNLEKGSEN